MSPYRRPFSRDLYVSVLTAPFADSSMACVVAQGVGYGLNVVVLIQQQQAALVGIFSYLAPIIGSVYPLAGRVGDYLTVIGRDFGAPAYSTPQVYIGGTTCPVVNFGPWTSPYGDSLVQCTVPVGAGVNKIVSVYLAGQGSTYTPTFSYLGPGINFVSPLFLSPGGNTIISMLGIGFGSAADYQQGRIGGTATHIASWTSDSSLTLSSPIGIGIGNNVVITIDQQDQTFLSIFSFESPMIYSLLSDGIAPIGNSSLTVVGSSFGGFDVTSAGNVAAYGAAGTGFTSSSWISDSSLLSIVASGSGVDLSVSVTIASLVGTILYELSYDAPAIHAAVPSNLETLGKSISTVSGYNFGSSRYSPNNKMGGTASTAIKWVSDSNMACKTAAGAGVVKVIITVQNNLGTSKLQASYDRPFILTPSATNFYVAGLSQIALTGSFFSMANSDPSAVLSCGNSRSLASQWLSDSSLVCTIGSGVGSNLDFVVAVAAISGTCLACITFNSPSISQSSVGNSPSFGGLNTVFGADFGAVSRSGSISERGSACEYMRWQSDSAVRCKATPGTWNFRAVVYTAGSITGTSTQIFTFDSTSPSSIKITNGPTSGESQTTVIVGQNFGQYSCSAYLAVGNTQVASTVWESDSTILCSRFVGIAGPANIQVLFNPSLVATKGATLSTAFSFDFPLVSFFTPSVLHTDASIATTLAGCDFGSTDSSLKILVGSTIVQASFWTSDTSLFSKPAAGVSGSQSVLLSVVNGVFNFGSPKTVSFASPALLLTSSNVPTLPTNSMPILGSGFGLILYSPSSATGISAAQYSLWMSDTAAACMITSGYGNSLKTIFTVGQVVGTSTKGISFDAKLISIMQQGNSPAAGSNALLSTLYGKGITSTNPSPILSMSSTRLLATFWQSDSSTAGRFCPGVGNQFQVSFTFYGTATTLTLAMSYDRPAISSLSQQNGPKSSALALAFFGIDYGSACYSPLVYLGKICRASNWISDSFILCLPTVQIGVYSLDASVLVGGQQNTWKSAYSFNFIQISTLAPSNTRAISATVATIVAANIDVGDTSPRSRFGSSAGGATLWMSMSSVQAKVTSGLGASLQFTLTADLFSGTTTAIFSFDDIAVSLSGISNHPFTSGALLAMNIKYDSGVNFGVSAAERLGLTTAAWSSWSSDSSLLCIPVYGFSGSRSSSITAGSGSIGTGTGVQSYDRPNLSSMSAGNEAVVGTPFITVWSPSYVQVSGTLRIGKTMASATKWVSQTSISGKVQPGSRATQSLLITAGAVVGSCSGILSYDAGGASTLASMNVAGSGHVYVSVRGVDFGTGSDSVGSRAGGTSCEGTAWTSDSTLLCKSSAGQGGSKAVTVTSGGRVGSVSRILSVDLMSASGNVRVSNSPSTGSISITVVSSGLGSVAWSCGSRMGGSACEASTWTSDSMLQIRAPSGASQTSVLSFTATARVRTGLYMASYDVPVLQRVPNSVDGYIQNQANGPCTGGTVVTLWGQGFGLYDLTNALTIGSFSCSVSGWSSDTSLYCLTQSGAGVLLSVFATVGQKAAQISQAFSFDSPQIESVIPPYSPATGGATIFLSGSNFGAMGILPLYVSVGSTYCAQILIVSDNTIRCVTPPGVSQGLLVSIFRSGFSFVSPELFSYQVPNIIFFQNSAGATLGGDSLLISGANFASFDSTISLRIGSTGTTATFWTSDTAFLGRTAAGTGSLNPVTGTVGEQTAVAATVFSYKAPAVMTLVPPNYSPANPTLLYLQGMNFGVCSVTGKTSESFTSTPSSTWTSDSSVISQSVRAVGKSIRISTTIGCQSNLNLVPASFDSASISGSRHGNAASKLEENLAVWGMSLAIFDSTVRSRALSTACEATLWSSDSFLSCKYTQGTSSSLGFGVTIVLDATYVTQFFTYDSQALMLSSIGNGPTYSSSMISSIGSPGGYAPFVITDSIPVGTYSGSLRIGFSSAPATWWISSSSIACKQYSGTRSTALAILTVSSISISLSAPYSYDRLMISCQGTINKNLAQQPFSSISIFAAGVGKLRYSLSTKSGSTVAEISAWTSDSCVSVLPSAGLGSSLLVSITSGITVGSMTSTLSYDKDEFSQLRSAGNIIPSFLWFSMNSANVQPAFASATSRLGATASSATLWISGTSLTCKVMSGSKSTLPLLFTSGVKVVSATEIVSYNSPMIRLLSTVAGNFPQTSSLTVFGFSFALTSRVSEGFSACQATLWTSDTSMTLSNDRNILRTIQIVLTSGGCPATISEALSYQPIEFKGSISNQAYNLGLDVLEITSSGVKPFMFLSVASRAGNSASESSVWSSLSSLLCRFPSGISYR